MISPQISEIFHDLAHAFHALSDLTYNFNGPEPQTLMCYPRMSPVHMMPQMPPNIQFGTIRPGGGNPQPGTAPTSSTASSTSQVIFFSSQILIYCLIDCM